MTQDQITTDTAAEIRRQILAVRMLLWLHAEAVSENERLSYELDSANAQWGINELQAELDEARAELTEFRAKAVVLPDDWRDQIDRHVEPGDFYGSEDVIKLFESWAARPAGGSGDKPDGWRDAMEAMRDWAQWHRDRADHHGDGEAADAYAWVATAAQCGVSDPDRAKRHVFAHCREPYSPATDHQGALTNVHNRPAPSEEPGEPRPLDLNEAGSGEGWDNAIDWLLNSRYMDPEAIEHFWHMCDQRTECAWCAEELRGTQWEVRPAPSPQENSEETR